MIAGLKPYFTYKDSGVKWLGEVPEHWQVLPNRALFNEIKERDHPEEQMLSVTITKGVIRQHALLADSSKKDSSNQDKSAYKFVRPGDIAYNKMRAWQGAVGVSDYQGIVSPAYVVQRPRKGTESRYFHYLLRTPAFAKEAERWSYGITSDMWSLRPEHFKMIYGCLPPHPEQTAIVRFLDHAARRIRRYIRAKQKLIELLNEQKQAIIHQAVTRGLDPNVRLKPSGVEWLGEVPEHWAVIPLKRCARIIDGDRGVEYPNVVDFVPVGIPFLSSKCIANGQVSFSNAAFISQEKFDRLRQGKLCQGDLVTTVRGTIGNCALFNSDMYPTAFINAQMMIISPKRRKISPEYLLCLTLSKYWRDQLNFRAYGSAQQQLSNQILSSQLLPIPPREEQLTVLRSLTSETAAFDDAIARIRRGTDFLREYRTRLIADVVTGKLDVRGVELPALDEAEMLEDLDTGEDAEEEEMGDIGEEDS